MAVASKKKPSVAGSNELGLISHEDLYQAIRKGLPKVGQGEGKNGKASEESLSSLESDVRLLGAMLGEVLLIHEGKEFYGFIERLRQQAKGFRQKTGKLQVDAFDAFLDKEIMKKPKAKRLEWVRKAAYAFRLFLDVTSMVEAYHQSERLNPEEHGLDGLFVQLKEQGVSLKEIERVLETASNRLIATAHPTQILPPTLLNHQHDVYKALQALHQSRTRLEQQTHLVKLKTVVATLWGSHSSRWVKPTVADEGAYIRTYLNRTIYKALPQLHEHINTACALNYGKELSLEAPFIKMGSWVGGDMDGNPYTLPESYETIVQANYQAILGFYRQDVLNAASQYTHANYVVSPSKALVASIKEDFAEMKVAMLNTSHLEGLASLHNQSHEMKLRLIAARLENTMTHTNQMMQTIGHQAFTYASPKQLLDDLDLVAHSMAQQKHPTGVLDTLKQKVRLFGFHFTAIELREDIENVTLTAQALLNLAHASIPTSSNKLLDLLNEEILSPKGISTVGMEDFSTLVKSEQDGWFVNRLMHMLKTARHAQTRIGRDVTPSLILSMTSSAAEIMQALLLLKAHGFFHKAVASSKRKKTTDYTSTLGIIPLFETVEDLKNAPKVLDQLFQQPAYQAQLAAHNHVQTVMLGYSDGNKDGGYFSCNWSLYQAQEAILNTAKQHGVRIRFYHGRGGNIGRGGGPTHRAIQALPVGSTHHGMDMTEQGEVLSRYYNVTEVAQAHLTMGARALLKKGLMDISPPKPTWRKAAQTLSHLALETYQTLVHHNPDSILYFEQATPTEIELLQIGSRPAKRRQMKSIKDLRAIPWVFRWSQSRHMLPGWYGLGTALEEFLAQDPEKYLPLLQTMYAQWPFFHNTIENGEVMLRQTDMSIAHYYSTLPSNQTKAQRVFNTLRTEYDRTCHTIQQVTGHPLLGSEKGILLQRSIALKEPYMDPLNYIQVRAIRAYRDLNDTDPYREEYERAIISSIEGVATGLGTTG